MAKTQSKATSEPSTFSLISNEKLLGIYATMLKCRLLEQRATALFQHGKLHSDLHISAGREATSAAAAIDLQQGDTLCLAQGDWIPAFVKGLSLESLFRVLAPASLNVAGAIQIEAEHKNIVFPSSRANLPEALLDPVRVALSEKNGAVAMAFIHSGADSLAQWKKAIHHAGTGKLPAIFVHYSDPTEAPSSPRPAKPEALVHGVPSIGVDARDPVAVYRVAYEAIVRARQLRGATLIECINPGGKSSLKDGQAALPETPDPIIAMESYLKAKNITPQIDNQEVLVAFNRELDLATRFLDK
jgi:TPP-dependent pyruvate/acetoin dehydrogenase alpha subunit